MYAYSNVTETVSSIPADLSEGAVQGEKGVHGTAEKTLYYMGGYGYTMQ